MKVITLKFKYILILKAWWNCKAKKPKSSKSTHVVGSSPLPKPHNKTIGRWKMPVCEDCLKDGVLMPMISQGEEQVKKRKRVITYVILFCIQCGSSIRVPKSSK